jgi:4-amino-4-deoxy-L-arabinose transferase-like glycosyltransferase
VGAAGLFFIRHKVLIYAALVQCTIYAVAAWFLWSKKNNLSEGENRRLLIYVLGLAALMRAVLVFAPPHSTDIYRYVWDGRVQAEHLSKR